MIPHRKMRSLAPLLAVALFVVALVAPAAKAANVPPLVLSAQYKALVKFVDKLGGLSNTPATTTQKATYMDQLENKHEATVNKATALFARGKKLAQAESQRAFKIGTRTIRTTEATELAALRRDYDSRMDSATARYQSELGHVENVFDARTATLTKQIKTLRNQKAKAEGALRKAEIQSSIDRRVQRLADNRKLLQEEVTDLEKGFRLERDEIRAAKATASRVVQQNDAEAIVTLRNRSNRIYNSRVRTLQNQRANQFNDLERKLNAGRSAIEKMPLAS